MFFMLEVFVAYLTYREPMRLMPHWYDVEGREVLPTDPIEQAMIGYHF